MIVAPFNTIRVEKGDDIAVITLDRRQRLNAWREGDVLAKAYVSAEHKEAVDAFLAKRQPVFRRLPPDETGA